MLERLESYIMTHGLCLEIRQTNRMDNEMETKHLEAHRTAKTKKVDDRNTRRQKVLL